jgi:hypothetical protein
MNSEEVGLSALRSIARSRLGARLGRVDSVIRGPGAGAWTAWAHFYRPGEARAIYARVEFSVDDSARHPLAWRWALGAFEPAETDEASAVLRRPLT